MEIILSFITRALSFHSLCSLFIISFTRKCDFIIHVALSLLGLPVFHLDSYNSASKVHASEVVCECM